MRSSGASALVVAPLELCIEVGILFALLLVWGGGCWWGGQGKAGLKP